MNNGNHLAALTKKLIRRVYRRVKEQSRVLDARLSGKPILEDAGDFPPQHWGAGPLPWGTVRTWRGSEKYDISRDGWKVVLGSGHKRLEGWLNLDVSPEFDPDLLSDISKGLPLKDSSVSAIVLSHVLEHVPDTVFVMNELWRVCCDDALVHIRVPHQDSLMALADPTHRRQFNEESFGYFCMNGGHYLYHESYGIRCRFELLAQRIYRHRRFGEVEVLLGAHKKPSDVATSRCAETVPHSGGYRPLEPLFGPAEIKSSAPRGG